jgi:probable F420-dependent oxidoreductase
MSTAHDSLRERLGRVGVWTFGFDGRAPSAIAKDVGAIEEAGYPALWIPEGGGSNDVLMNLAWLLGASEHLTVASGIANISAREPDVLARGAGFLRAAYDDRLVLGVGVGHSYTTVRRGIDWDRPLARMRAYLEVMDDASDATAPPRLLAALGDGMLRLSADRALGAHTYFVPVEHTAHARDVLGPEPVIAVELGIVPGADTPTALAAARAWAASYLELPNYANNWRRLGFGEDDVTGGGSEELLRAAIAWGDADTICDRVRAHLDAGADHVCVQVLEADDTDTEIAALVALAPELLSV